MALQAPSPAVASSLTSDAYTTPQHAEYYTHSQASSGATARPLPTTQSSPRTPSHGVMSSDAYDRARNSGRTAQPPPRTSSQQRSVALATDAQLADRTRSRGSSKSGFGSPANMRPDVSRGNSEVINNFVVDDPKVDIQREQARIAESVPESQQTRGTSMPTLSVSGTHDAVKPVMKRQDFSSTKRKEARLGDYILGQTLGEGEFGKVKLGWKKDGSVQVAVKLIRRENLNTNPSRLPKIYREISILGKLAHPNIVKLHEMVETERYIGIILEYASGGELFDYILTHRYLKDNAARRLFAQLVSGVGYLHKKGIVHRDLKLENLLLDRNRNLMITDFGFANTFDPRDELDDETQNRINDKDFVRKMDLERIHPGGVRRGDLMQTSCGSPCYAAPELVVSDSLYTGRKVDVWSCGVILYAMLAGYLPFDDDPANPEGDNINLLYKYICSTPLTFPEYVTPHARDLLRRILVPDPRKRADLFEVARHSWLAEYAHVVEHITSTTTTIDDYSKTAPVLINPAQAPPLARSASVREPTKLVAPPMSPVGGLQHQTKFEGEPNKDSSPRDPKRRTVQVEYVAPRTQTTRGEASPPVQPGSIGVPSTVPAAPRGETQASQSSAYQRMPISKDPPGGEDIGARENYPPPRSSSMAPPTRPGREVPRSVSDSTGAFAHQPPARPTTGGSMSSTSAGRLPSRGNSYSQPLAPTVAATSASGRIAQPKGARQYTISHPIPQPEPYIADNVQRPTSQRMPSVRKGSQQSGPSTDGKGHKRSTTLGSIFRPLTGGKAESPRGSPRPDKRYPPTSMKAPISSDSPRASSDSRRRPSFSITRKPSGSDQSSAKHEKPSRRFSLIPASFSLRNFGGGNGNNGGGKKDSGYVSASSDRFDRQPQRGTTASGSGRPNDSVESMVYSDRHGNQGVIPPRSAPHQAYPVNAYAGDSAYDSYQSRLQPIMSGRNSGRPASQLPPHSQAEFAYGQQQPLSQSYSGVSSQIPHSATAPQLNYESSGSQQSGQQQYNQQSGPGRYPPGFNEYDDMDQPQERQSRSASVSQGGGKSGRVLQKNNRKFVEGYDDAGHGGSTSAAKRVMDFFRRRGKARVEGQ